MPAILPYANFLVAVLIFRQSMVYPRGSRTDWRAAFLMAMLVTGAFTAVLAEITGAFHILDRLPLAIGWGILLIVQCGYAYARGLLRVPRLSIPGLLSKIRSTAWEDGILLAIIAMICFLLFIVARYAPPNTNDSLSYHMSRVMHWAQNRSLAPYPTPIDRQVWMAPFAEISVLQLFLLLGSDRLANLVQWSSMLGALTGVSLIAKCLGAGRRGQILASLFAATLPMGIAQATSTQTDYVTSLWVVCLAYFAVLAYQRELHAVEWIGAGLAFGLGLLTKGSYITFALPFVFWIGISVLKRSGWRSCVRIASLVLGLTVLLNGAYWARNLQVYGFPLGPKEVVRQHSNELFTPAAILSNLIRNSTLHLGTSFGVINGPVYDVVEGIHRIIGMDINDPRTSDEAYRIKFSRHEDYAGNPLHFLLIPVILGMLAISRRLDKTGPVMGYVLVVLAEFVVFSALLKWQRPGSRLQLPFFIMFAPVAGLAFDNVVHTTDLLMSPKRFRLIQVQPRLGYLFSFGLLLFSIRSLIANPSRPLINVYPDAPSILEAPRHDSLFYNFPEIRHIYERITSDVKAAHCTQVGLGLDSHDSEYPLWYLLSRGGEKPRIEHLGIVAPLGLYASTDIQPCAVICSICTPEQIEGFDVEPAVYANFRLYLQP